MGAFLDLSGYRFGRLVVIERGPDRIGRRGVANWVCLCDCGKSVRVEGGALKSANTRSCGCLRRDLLTSHGLAAHPLRRLWLSMNERCHKPDHKQYSYYGGRGIYVCDEWRSPYGFARFIENMGPRPPKMTLDRIDNDGPYTKANCRWATYTTQERNRRNNRIISYDGKSACMSEWAEHLGISSAVLYQRFLSGMSIDKALRPGLHYFRGPRTRDTDGRYADDKSTRRASKR